jgi:hypothetical protein
MTFEKNISTPSASAYLSVSTHRAHSAITGCRRTVMDFVLDFDLARTIAVGLIF